VGRIAEIDESGRALVEFAGAAGPVLARSTLEASSRAGEARDALIGAKVLLTFEEGHSDEPIIIGLVREELRPDPLRPEVTLDLAGERDVVLDGERLVLEGRREILLRCGKSSLLLRRDGKVVIRGADLVSRSTGPNRIKGGTISLN
jgi:hypothetical protein